MAKNKKEEQTYGVAFEKISQEDQNQINQINNGISFKTSTNIVIDDKVNPFIEKVAMTDGTNTLADDATGTPKTKWDEQDERVTSGNSWDDKTISIVS